MALQPQQRAVMRGKFKTRNQSKGKVANGWETKNSARHSPYNCLMDCEYAYAEREMAAVLRAMWR